MKFFFNPFYTLKNFNGIYQPYYKTSKSKVYKNVLSGRLTANNIDIIKIEN